MVVLHANWIKLHDALQQFDANPTDTFPSPIRHREATRLTSHSQFGAGAWLDTTPDCTLSFAKQRTALHTIALQRKLGLYLSAAKDANDELAAIGEIPDHLGDELCNAREHNRRHNTTNTAWYNALSSVATGPVILCDKDRQESYALFDKSKCPDIAQPGASPSGSDWLGDTKVKSPFTQTHHAGRGSPQNGGTIADVGHDFAFGNTEEGTHLENIGCRSRGRQSDGFFDHTTGKGWVKEQHGAYHDSLHVKNNKVVMLLVETSGAIGRHAARALRHAARTANKKHGCDRTKYSRIHHTPYLAHHARAISGAAVFSDAAHIELGIMFKKQRVAPAPVDGATDRI